MSTARGGPREPPPTGQRARDISLLPVRSELSPPNRLDPRTTLCVDQAGASGDAGGLKRRGQWTPSPHSS
jgi:hypothetical protein